MQTIQRFSENYVEPFIHHKATQFTFKVTAELVKIVAAKIFLEYLGKHYLNDPLKMSQRTVHELTVLTPLVEELLFRFVLLKGIYVIQRQCSAIFASLYNSPDRTSELIFEEVFDEENRTEDGKIQQVFRVHLSALIFAALHLTNPHPNKLSAITQFCWSYLGGVIYGYLTEKYHSLAPSIIAHGLNNSIVVAAQIYPPETAPVLITAIITNRIGSYFLAVTQIDEIVVRGLGRAASICFSFSERLFHWRNQQEFYACESA